MGLVSRTAYNQGDVPPATGTEGGVQSFNTQFDEIFNEFNGSIEAANLASDAVENAKIKDGAVSTDKLGTMEYYVIFSYNASIGASAESVRQVRLPVDATATRIIAYNGASAASALSVNIVNDGGSMLAASSLAVTGASAVATACGADLANTYIAAGNELRLDIVDGSTGGGQPLVINIFLDVD